jgi:large subunit ribosomal protein L29
MASKKFLELQEFSDSDLASELQETVVQYKKLKFDHALKGLENPLLLRDVRKDVARLRTEVRRREVSAMSPESLQKRSKLRLRRRLNK